MKRRAFLRLSGLTPALLLLQQVPFSPSRAEASPGPARLEPDQAELLMSIVERMVDTGTAVAPPPREIGTQAALEAILSRLDEEFVSALRIALQFVEWWPVFLEGKFRRFSKLDREEQNQSLEGWSSSSIEGRRAVFAGLRKLALLAYWSRPETWPLIGYGGPWIGRRT